MVSYLISFVIGDYVKVEDNYKDIQLLIGFILKIKEAFRSFGKTPDILEF